MAECLAIPLSLGPRVGCCDCQVVDTARAHATRRVALRAIGKRGALLGRGDVALDLPEDLVEMAARRSVAKRWAVADRASSQPSPTPAAVNRRTASPNSRTLGAPADVRQRRLWTLGELERVMEAIAPGPQVHRLTVARRLLQPDESVQNASDSSGTGVVNSTWANCDSRRMLISPRTRGARYDA